MELAKGTERSPLRVSYSDIKRLLSNAHIVLDSKFLLRKGKDAAAPRGLPLTILSCSERSVRQLNRKRSPTATRHSSQKRFNVPKGADAKTIPKLFAKFERTVSVDDNPAGNVGPRQTVVTSKNVAKVSGVVEQNPRNTVRRIASETGLKR
ncbi:hypothetical protein AVEN_3557-1 [Araneus ventricosus]|uniref:DUF4817 domain-containing protein n=1 Tax=Araneus ventricosus TaxID=182803 RepID=A0A4Y2U1N9_ARAVE|nr:hypothetical protein AVEN_228062-1 [Araneus ventricosus]GBO05579.1 hypothetical protein AVEN_3557-1 [Araneus ventricosus]